MRPGRRLMVGEKEVEEGVVVVVVECCGGGGVLRWWTVFMVQEPWGCVIY